MNSKDPPSFTIYLHVSIGEETFKVPFTKFYPSNDRGSCDPITLCYTKMLYPLPTVYESYHELCTTHQSCTPVEVIDRLFVHNPVILLKEYPYL